MFSQQSSELLSTQEFSTQDTLPESLRPDYVDEPDVWARLGVRYTKKKTLGMKSPLFVKQPASKSFEIGMSFVKVGRAIYNNNMSLTSELKGKVFSAGRSTSNDFCFGNENTSWKALQRLSNVHFKIREETDKGELLVIIKVSALWLWQKAIFDSAFASQDLSTNGTYVNGEKVGSENERLLRQSDVISVLGTDEGLTFTFMPAVIAQNDLPPLVNAHFQVGRILGAGAFGEVHLVRYYKTCQQLAIKVVQRKRDTEDTILNEANLLKRLEHPVIIKMHHIHSFDKVVVIWLEYMAGGSLADRLQDGTKIPEETARYLFYQIFHGVKYLHENNVVHRDLKPDNILLSSCDEFPIVKITDFGLSKLTRYEESLRTFVGTVAFTAPEILQENGDAHYTNKVDTWSLGVILYLCLTGHYPFDDDGAQTEEMFLERFATDCDHVSESGRTLISGMLTFDAHKRPSVNHLLVQLWFDDDIIQLARKRLAESTTEVNTRIDFDHIFSENR